MPAFAQRSVALGGLRTYAASFGLGTLMTLALPPAGIFPVVLFCVPGFVALARAAQTKRAAFLIGWAFGAGYFIVGLYWVSIALFVDIAQFWWVLPLSAVIGPAVLALFYGLIPLLAWRYRADAALHALVFAASWAAIEWVRGHALTGFPWNLAGQAWHRVLPVLQLDAALGIYGLTLLTLLWATLPLFGRRGLMVAALAFLIAVGGGAARLWLNPTAESGASVRIIQPNIPETLKWDKDEAQRNFAHILSLTALPAQKPVSFVVWPETAITADLQQSPGLAREIAAHFPAGAVGLLGTLRVTEDQQYFNSVTFLSTQGDVTGQYDKHHLVPFGEYIPFRAYLDLTPIAAGISGIGDFTPGTGPATLPAGGLPAPSPLICYEAIFPGAVARTDARPGWLLNVTNDAWYGRSTGPYQHLEIARLRAVEEGLPLIRAANTGVSAVIDPLGRVLAQAPLGSTGIIDALLPASLPPTIYSRFGDALFFLMLALLAILGETLRGRKP